MLDTVIEHLELEARIGGYAAADVVADRSPAVYASVATLRRRRRPTRSRWSRTRRARGTWSSTRWARRSVPATASLTSRAEYASNVIGLLQLAARTGASVEVVPDDETGQLVGRRARGDARRPRAAGGDVVDPDAGRPREPGGGGRRGDACGWRALPPRRVPGRRPPARSTSTRSGATSCRRPAASTCARRGAPACSTCGATWIERARPAVPRRARRALGARRPSRGRVPTPAASRAGSAASPTSSASAPRSTTRWRSASTPSGRGCWSWRRRCATQLAAIPGLALHDRGVERCGIVTFTVDGVDVVRARRAPARGAHQHLGVDHRLRALRLRGARARAR